MRNIPASCKHNEKSMTQLNKSQLNKFMTQSGLNKSIVGFDYFDKIFITLSETFGTLSIASHATVVGVPVGIAGASLTLIFTISTGINKSLLKSTKKRKRNTIK